MFMIRMLHPPQIIRRGAAASENHADALRHPLMTEELGSAIVPLMMAICQNYLMAPLKRPLVDYNHHLPIQLLEAKPSLPFKHS